MRPNDNPIGAFVQAQRRRGLSPLTIAKRRCLLHAIETWLDDGRPVLGADRHAIEAWLDDCQLCPRSRYSYISNLSAFYQWAIDEDLIDTDPTARIRRPRYGRSIPRPIGDEDLLWAMRCAPPRMMAWICLAAYEGLRCKEIAGVMVEDLLLAEDPPLLIVSAAKYDRQRVVPLNPNTESALRIYGIPRAGALFPGVTRLSPMASSSVSKLLNAFLHEHGVTSTAHQLRHWFGTKVYRATRDLRLTQELMGHANPSSTAVYTEVSPGEDGVAVVRALVARKRTVPAMSLTLPIDECLPSTTTPSTDESLTST